MKIKVVQFYCGMNDVYNQLVNQVKEINSKYCQLHNYEYQLIIINNQQVEQFVNNNIFRWNINAYKFKVIYEQLIQSDCDYLVFLDADAVISKPTIKIEDIIDLKHDLFFSRSDSMFDQKRHVTCLSMKLKNMIESTVIDKYHFEHIMDLFDLYTDLQRLLLGYLFINEGLIVIKNNQLMKDFFRDAITLVPHFNDLKYNRMTTDGRIIHFLTLRNKYKDCWCFMYDQAQGSHLSKNEAKYDEEKTFVLHDYQIGSFNTRLNNIRNVKQNKWWKGYFNE